MQDKKKKRKKRSKVVGWAVPALITLCMFAGGAIGIKTMMKTDESKRRRQIQMIKVLEPQAPPKRIEEEPPELEEQHEVKQEVQEIAQEQFVEDTAHQDTNENADEATAGQDLGLDADGTAGSDGFGLVAKKGGRALVGSSPGGGGTGSSLLGRYGWYIRKIQDEIRDYLQKELEKDGGIPNGNLQTTLRIVLDEQGRITSFEILGSSGNSKMDSAIQTAMKYINIDETPPEGMPKALKIRISSKG